MFQGKITFIDVGNIKAGTTLVDIPAASTPDMTKLLGLATSLHSYVFPGVFSYALLNWTEGAMTTPLASATGSNCDKAQINYSWLDANDETQYGTLWIPNPDPSHFELVQGVGYRMLSASKVLLETSLSAASGLDINVLEGKMEYQVHEAGKGARHESCLEFIDAAENISYMSFPLASSSILLIALGDALNTDAFTQSVLAKSYFLAKTEAMPDPSAGAGLPAAGTWDCVETRAYAKFAYMEGGKKKYQTLMLPGIRQTDCEQEPGQKGWKLNAVTGAGIGLALTSFYGTSFRNLRFVGSRIDVKQLQNQ